MLEHEREAKRLEEQNVQPSYSLVEELKGLELKDHMHILDAGCGSGFLSRFLLDSNPTLKISACDFSDVRLQQAKNLNQEKGYSQVNFFHSELTNINLPDESVDVIVSRFVFEYLQNPLQVLNEFRRVLKPGGIVHLIDLDGVFINIHSENDRFNELLQIVTKAFDETQMIDLHVGRKLKSYLHQANFLVKNETLTTHFFTGDEAFLEQKNNKERFKTLSSFFIETLKSEEVFDEFRELYLSEMVKEGCTNFMNKFVVSAQK